MILNVGLKGSGVYQLHGLLSCGQQMFSLKLGMAVSNTIQLLRSVRQEGHRRALRNLGQPGGNAREKGQEEGGGKERFLLSSYWPELCHVITFQRLEKSFLGFQVQ